MTAFSSPVPVGCRYTSGFSHNRWLNGVRAPHAGGDWAPPRAGQAGVPIFAVADGKIVALGTGVLAGHSGKIVVVDHGVLSDAQGSDWIRTNYGHLASINPALKLGDKVRAGQLIGIMGATGNVTGIHIHLGVAEVTRHNGRLKLTYFDPKVWLARKGIVPGKTAPLALVSLPSQGRPPVVVKPAGTVKPKPVKASAADKNLQTRLAAMSLYKGLIDGKPQGQQKAAVKAFQTAHGLVPDGVWGSKTEAMYQRNVKVQKAMNKWTAVIKRGRLKVDGYIGRASDQAVIAIKTSNKGGVWKSSDTTKRITPAFLNLIGVK